MDPTLDPQASKVVHINHSQQELKRTKACRAPFPPSFFTGVLNEKAKYEERFTIHESEHIYLTNDGAITLGHDNHIRLTGRLDEIMKVAGHALSTAELENALCKHKVVAETAVVPVYNEIKYEVPLAFIVLQQGVKGSQTLEAVLRHQVDELIGPIARPEKILFVEDLPRTRSGKIIRRLLRDLVHKLPLSDSTSLVNPDCLPALLAALNPVNGKSNSSTPSSLISQPPANTTPA